MRYCEKCINILHRIFPLQVTSVNSTSGRFSFPFAIPVYVDYSNIELVTGHSNFVDTIPQCNVDQTYLLSLSPPVLLYQDNKKVFNDFRCLWSLEALGWRRIFVYARIQKPKKAQNKQKIIMIIIILWFHHSFLFPRPADEFLRVSWT